MQNLNFLAFTYKMSRQIKLGQYHFYLFYFQKSYDLHYTIVILEIIDNEIRRYWQIPYQFEKKICLSRVSIGAFI